MCTSPQALSTPVTPAAAHEAASAGSSQSAMPAGAPPETQIRSLQGTWIIEEAGQHNGEWQGKTVTVRNTDVAWSSSKYKGEHLEVQSSGVIVWLNVNKLISASRNEATWQHSTTNATVVWRRKDADQVMALTSIPTAHRPQELHRARLPRLRPPAHPSEERSPLASPAVGRARSVSSAQVLINLLSSPCYVI